MMRRTHAVVTLALLALALAACGPSGPSEMELQLESDWAALQETKKALDAQRQELAALRQQVAAAAEAAEGEGEGEGEMEGEPPPTVADVEALEAELAAGTEEFTGKLVAFLNADPMIEGEPPSERQLAALHMKSEEDILLAREWIEKGGDYKRAIDIYQTALRFDPDNQALKDGLAEAEEQRFMSQERFALAKKGMSEAEVRAALGQVNLRNVREFPDDKVIAWFYPTSDDGSAAGVYFREGKAGYRVYRLSYEAVKPQGAEEAS